MKKSKLNIPLNIYNRHREIAGNIIEKAEKEWLKDNGYKSAEDAENDLPNNVFEIRKFEGKKLHEYFKNKLLPILIDHGYDEDQINTFKKIFNNGF